MRWRFVRINVQLISAASPALCGVRSRPVQKRKKEKGRRSEEKKRGKARRNRALNYDETGKKRISRSGLSGDAIINSLVARRHGFCIIFAAPPD